MLTSPTPSTRNLKVAGVIIVRVAFVVVVANAAVPFPVADAVVLFPVVASAADAKLLLLLLQMLLTPSCYPLLLLPLLQ